MTKLLKAETLMIPVLLVAFIIVLGFASSCSTTYEPGSSEQSDGVEDLATLSSAEKLRALRAAAKTAPVGLYYLGDSYAGMTLSHASTPFLGDKWPTWVRYQSEDGSRSLQIDVYTPDTYAAQQAGSFPADFPSDSPARTAPSPGAPDFVYQVGGPVQTVLLARRGDAVIVVRGGGGMERKVIAESGQRLERIDP